MKRAKTGAIKQFHLALGTLYYASGMRRQSWRHRTSMARSPPVVERIDEYRMNNLLNGSVLGRLAILARINRMERENFQMP